MKTQTRKASGSKGTKKASTTKKDIKVSTKDPVIAKAMAEYREELKNGFDARAELKNARSQVAQKSLPPTTLTGKHTLMSANDKKIIDRVLTLREKLSLAYEGVVPKSVPYAVNDPRGMHEVVDLRLANQQYVIAMLDDCLTIQNKNI